MELREKFPKWWKIVDRVCDNDDESFTDNEHQLSANWGTCAIGERQKAIIQLNIDGSQYVRLHHLGIDFVKAISNSPVARHGQYAKEILTEMDSILCDAERAKMSHEEKKRADGASD